jgi:alanyl-tRNA synthetase
MQFNRKANGSLEPLQAKNVDTGMGFERLCMILQGKKSNYDTDVFQPTIARIAALSGKEYGKDEKADVAMRVIADHLRAISFSIADGQLPANAKAGYVIRRILRRAVRYGYTYLGFTEPFICKLVKGLVEQMGHQFPELVAQQTLIERVIEEEEASFLRTLATGINLLEGVIKKSTNGKISGKDAFVLYDTYGFPIDLTDLIAREQGVSVDLEEFEKELQVQKERSRNAASQDIDDWQEIMPISESKFIGYDNLTADINIARYRRVRTKNATTYQLVFDQTPFYGNSGGQIGDTGYIESANEKIEIVATEKENGLIIHIAKQLPENPSATFRAVVDAEARQKIANNHTATHLVDYALRTVLGTHVEQKGSMVTPQGLRFDFSHFQKVTAEEIREVERLVNKLVRTNYPLVENREATMAEAEAAGAIMLFGEKYGDKVRIVNFGPSTELCGGTHTSATGTIGLFKIVSESAISAGVRRIDAVTGDAAEALVYEAQDTISSIEQIVRSPKLVQAVEKMADTNAALGREIEEMRKEKVAQLAATIAAETEAVNGIALIKRTTNYSSEVMKDLAFGLRQRVSEGLVMVIGNLSDGKPTINIMLSDDVVAKGVDAGATVREAAKLINGGGGGQKHYATAGGKNVDGLQAAVDKAVELIMEKIK